MKNFGYIYDEAAIEEVMGQLPNPLYQTTPPDTSRDVMNHLLYKQLVGHFCNHEPNQPFIQEIGDCVDWAACRSVDYAQVLDSVYDADTPLEFQKIAKSIIYGGSRVQIGGGRIGGDGSVGAWAFLFLKRYGAISQKHLREAGFDPTYSGNRARQLGRSGVPSNVLPEVAKKPVEDVTKVLTFNAAASHLQSGRPIMICSNIGFENYGDITLRDAQGFASPRGSWNHAMMVSSVRFGSRPGLLIENQWPLEMVRGPMGDIELPPCSWWVDAHVVERMLKQGDSWTLTNYKGYPVRELKWSH